VIWRLFRRKSSTTETVSDEAGEEQVTSQGPATPRLSTFSFQAPTVDLDDEKSEGLEGSDTAVQATAVDPPKVNVADLVREKVGSSRHFSSRHRGVSPAFIPSIREMSTCMRIEAETLGFTAPKLAMKAWKDYLRLHPRDAESWFSFGQCAVVLNYDDVATQAFNTVLHLHGGHGLAHGALGFVFARQGGLDMAIAHYERASECRPGCVDMMSELARLYERIGAKTQADELWVEIELLSNERVLS
jgi:hypothetical protein